MKPDVAAEVAWLDGMSVHELSNRFKEVFGEECRSRHKRYLVRRVAWRLQAMAEGLNSKIMSIKRRAGGFRNPENFKTAIYFHCGGLSLYP